ncbi:MAG: hypothetical protein WDN07_01575 [Actinomycetota bacterium]
MWLLLAIPVCIWLIGWHRGSAYVLIAALLSGAGLMAVHERALESSIVSPLLDKRISVRITAIINERSQTG